MILQELISSHTMSDQITGSPAFRPGDFVFITAFDEPVSVKNNSETGLAEQAAILSAGGRSL